MRLIDADALIVEIKNCLWDWESVNGITAKTVLNQTITDIGNMPTIDPIKHGKWIKDDVGVHCSECFCGWEFLTGIPVEVYEFHYCPNCGARVSDNWEEPEINPCRGCDDYDGRGSCKSHGGCGEERNKE